MHEGGVAILPDLARMGRHSEAEGLANEKALEDIVVLLGIRQQLGDPGLELVWRAPQRALADAAVGLGGARSAERSRGRWGQEHAVLLGRGRRQRADGHQLSLTEDELLGEEPELGGGRGRRRGGRHLGGARGPLSRCPARRRREPDSRDRSGTHGGTRVPRSRARPERRAPRPWEAAGHDEPLGGPRNGNWRAQGLRPEEVPAGQRAAEGALD
mmetsp:Transcript_381/g.980  ORF Transcript_381/g.980 Transcript_381/m.980 type:complete len:214 (-) Transcript_381:881-1522(-)